MNKDGLIEQLYRRYYGSLMVIACSYTRDKAAAEDLVQNDFLNSLRTEKYRADTEAEMLEAADCFDLMENLMHNEKKARLAAMIAALPLRQRVIMVESVYLEQSDAEIAQAHAMTVVNVRQIRSRAKKALMKMMANEEEANE